MLGHEPHEADFGLLQNTSVVSSCQICGNVTGGTGNGYREETVSTVTRTAAGSRPVPAGLAPRQDGRRPEGKPGLRVAPAASPNIPPTTRTGYIIWDAQWKMKM